MLYSYPSSQKLANNSSAGVVTFAGGASDNILVPDKSIASSTGPLVVSSNLTDTATACPGFWIETYRMASGQKTALMFTPVLLGTANDTGSNDAAGKSAVVSIVACSDVSRMTPATPESSSSAKVLRRSLLAQLKFTGDSGTGLAVVGADVVRKLTTDAEFATYTAANARAVYASTCAVLSGMLLPTNLIQYGMNTWGFDPGPADFIEVYVSCVGDVTGTPARSAPAFASFYNFLLL